MALVLSPPQRSPLILTSRSTSCGSISSAVTMQGPKTFEPSQSFALHGPMPIGQLAGLGVAGRHVVPDRVPEDVLQRCGLGDVLAGASDDGGELELVVQLLRVRRPGDLVVGTDHGVGQPLVVGGHAVPLVGDLLAQACERVLQVPFEGQEVADRARAEGRQESRRAERPRRTRRTPGSAGFDEGDHVAVEADVDDLVAVEVPDPAGPSRGLVGHVLHVAASSMASMIFR